MQPGVKGPVENRLMNCNSHRVVGWISLSPSTITDAPVASCAPVVILSDDEKSF